MAIGSGSREFVLKIVGDVKDALTAVDKVGTETKSMKDKMIGVGKSVATGLAVGAVVAFGKASVDSAMEADESMDKVQSVFGSAAKVVEDFSKTTAESMGLSAQDYQAMAGQTGALLQSVGVGSQEAAKQTEVLSQRAADLAAIYGGTAQDAMGQFDKALTGQTKGLKAYGLVVSKAEIDQRAMAKGYVDAEGKVTAAGRAIAAQEIILEKSSKQAGAFADNSGDLGAQQQILAARMENLKTVVGNMLLPVLEDLMKIATPILNFIQDNITWIAPLVAAIAGLVIGLKAWAIAQAILNSTLLANPIFLVVAAIAALVAGIIWAYNNVGWFKDAVDAMAKGVVAAFEWIRDTVVGVFNWIKENWPLLLAILTGPFGLAVLAIIKNWDSIKDFFTRLPGLIGGWLAGVGEAIAAPFRKGAEIVANAWNPIRNFFTGFGSMLNSVWGGIADIIVYPFKKAFELIKWLWNSTVGGFGFSVPSWIPLVGGKDFRIPKMATGGIVTRPTIAMIGEAGPEAVIPLSRMNGGGGDVIYNVNVYALNANAETGRLVAESLREYNRTTGGDATR